ncbi:MAG TPA: heme exporter protein CcmD [Stellaceae bacterium]|nr:heme exporter protein CcmD [Stellaceae bacterium]
MQTVARWAAMGGYAMFVWPAYGVAVAVLGGMAVHAWRRHRQSGDELTRLQPPSGGGRSGGRGGRR